MADPIYRIHPAIGIARVGNADRATFFVGPEFPNFGPAGPPSLALFNYKSGGLIKPQAARFRVYEYLTNKKGELYASREVNLGHPDCESITWKVHLANRKASFFQFQYLNGESPFPQGPRRNASVTNRRTLDIDPLPRSITGKSKGPVEFRKGTSSNPTSELWPTPAPSPPIEYLGELRTDDGGRLLVIGGMGKASGRTGATLGVPDTFNSDGWFDDVSDGPVTADIVMVDSKGKRKTYKVEPAWVLCGPPDFAPGLTNFVTLYDLLFDMAARRTTLPANELIYDDILKPLFAINQDFVANGGARLTSYKPDYDLDIYPILLRALQHAFTHEQLKTRHLSFNTQLVALGDPAPAKASLRKFFFDYIRKPETVGTAQEMPKLHGDQWGNAASKFRLLTVTKTQYAMLERWATGQFVKTGGALPPPRPKWHDDITAHGLDRAAIENCVGGAFAPGIEVSWQIRNTMLFADAFRIDHKAVSQYLGDTSGTIRAGHFSRQMSLPWHTDFHACKFDSGYGWWPAIRPDIVYLSAADFHDRNKAGTRPPQAWIRSSGAAWPSGGAEPSFDEFVVNFYKLGFVREGPVPLHLEQERGASVP